jgi:hypothetical protein
MSFTDEFQKYPGSVRLDKQRADQLFVQTPDYYAVHGAQVASHQSEAIRLSDRVTIVPGKPEESAAASPSAGGTGVTITPVYRLGARGPLAVPTGLVFLRLEEDRRIEDYEDRIASAGYRIAGKLDYAPNSGWLESATGTVADALRGIDKLESLPHVANVAPQMLMQSASRPELDHDRR